MFDVRTNGLCSLFSSLNGGSMICSAQRNSVCTLVYLVFFLDLQLVIRFSMAIDYSPAAFNRYPFSAGITTSYIALYSHQSRTIYLLADQFIHPGHR